MRFKDKVVVVTGASSGMGRAISQAFAKEGATVVAVARRKERLEELAESCKDEAGRIIPFPGDVSLKEVNEAMIDLAVKEGGAIDILVNNAGIVDEFMPVGEVSDELWKRVMTLNVDGPMYACRKAIQYMVEQENGGNIINIASIGGLHGCRAGVAYTASKYALVGLTQNTAFMYAKKNIRCNAVCPGGVETEVGVNLKTPSALGMERIMGGLDATMRQGTANEIADVVLFLAGSEASFINGAAIPVDGGVSCN